MLEFPTLLSNLTDVFVAVLQDLGAKKPTTKKKGFPESSSFETSTCMVISNASPALTTDG